MQEDNLTHRVNRKLAILLALFAGASFGLSACINHIGVFALLFFIPLVWLAFPNRWIAALFIVSFYTSFCWEIVPDLLNYIQWRWSVFFHALATWGVASVFPTIPWLICFPKISTPRFYRNIFPLLVSLFFLFLCLTIPPWGVLCWGNPLTSAGLFYPGFSWFGMLCCFLWICSIAVVIYVPPHRNKALYCAGFFLALSVFAQVHFSTIKKAPETWVGIDTNSRFTSFDSYLIELIKEQVNHGKHVIILPENMINLDHLHHDVDWQHLIRFLQMHDAVVISGAFEIPPDALTLYQGFFKKHTEGVVIIEDGHINFHYSRQPLPIMSWRPIGAERVSASWLRTGVYQVKDKRVGVFVCFEDFVPWMMLMIERGHPDILISIANHWWNMPTAIHKQLWIFQCWGRLLNLPVLISENTFYSY